MRRDIDFIARSPILSWELELLGANVVPEGLGEVALSMPAVILIFAFPLL